MSKELNINITKLSSVETVRYNGPDTKQSHGVYTINVIQGVGTGNTNHVHIHLSLEALMQLRTRIDAALQHMITH